MTSTKHTPTGSPILAVGFGATVAMWTVGYVCHLPLVSAPPWATLIGSVICVLAGGWVFGRYAQRGVGAAVGTALLAALVNLLVLGSLLQDSEANLPSPAIWLPGFAAAMVVLFMIGRVIAKPKSTDVNWRFILAVVAVAATGLLIVAGGLVTGYDAGLSVPDWPQSFQANMFLYPLSRMTGAIYYEHAHRLFGSLVGLTTIVLAVALWRMDSRPRWKLLLVVAVVAVIVQGIMGGVRVTAAETGETGVAYATQEHENALSTALRVAHGVFGQIFLGLLTGITMLTMRSFANPPRDVVQTVSPGDRTLAIVLILGLILQLAIGAILRHVDQLLLVHISFASVVLMLAIAAGVRAWGVYGQRNPVMHKLGLWLMITVLVQLTLGIAALVAINYTDDLSINALVTTAHQAVGAGLLCLAVVYAMWCGRLVTSTDPKITDDSAAAACL